MLKFMCLFIVIYLVNRGKLSDAVLSVLSPNQHRNSCDCLVLTVINKFEFIYAQEEGIL